MRRETVWRSWYSLMSKRMNSMPIVFASCLASSVLPTPVGPVKRNDPMGFSGERRPARASLMALASWATASSWPNTTPCRSFWRSRNCALSDVETWRGGICAIFATTISMSETPIVYPSPCARRAAAPASSTKSMALSGKRRSRRYDLLSLAAASSASSVKRTLWNSS